MKPAPLHYATYRDRVLAGWLGKSIGGAMGAPVENQKQRHQFTEETIWPARHAPGSRKRYLEAQTDDNRRGPFIAK
jgi:ADP-ribosylglycohydrolase